MSSSSVIDYYQFLNRQINIYVGLFIFFTGIFGNIFNIAIFLTLKTFRQALCSIYLITTSIANVIILILLLSRVTYDGFNFGLPYTAISCKIRFFIAQSALFISLATMTFATINQFISMTKYKKWSQLRTAYYIITSTCIIAMIESSFSLIYFDANPNACKLTNVVYAQFYTYFQTPILFGFLPLGLMIVFSSLAFFKIRTIASRQINIVRLSRDRQLTAMTLFHVLYIIIAGIPFLTFYVFTYAVNAKDPIELARNQLIYTITIFFFYTNYSWSFYIYCCASKRFRKQVKHVLVDINLNHWRHRINSIHNNQISPITMEFTHEDRRAGSVEHHDIALY